MVPLDGTWIAGSSPALTVEENASFDACAMLRYQGEPNN
jgi:hypothetical protein